MKAYGRVKAQLQSLLNPVPDEGTKSCPRSHKLGQCVCFWAGLGTTQTLSYSESNPSPPVRSVVTTVANFGKDYTSLFGILIFSQFMIYVFILSCVGGYVTSITGSGLDDWIYWCFLKIRVNYNHLSQLIICDCLRLVPFPPGLRASSFPLWLAN
jgi:hypothetical protein